MQAQQIVPLANGKPEREMSLLDPSQALRTQNKTEGEPHFFFLIGDL